VNEAAEGAREGGAGAIRVAVAAARGLADAAAAFVPVDDDLDLVVRAGRPRD